MAIVLSLILLNVYANIIITDNIIASQTPICGIYPNTTEINVQGIFNSENYTLQNVTATINANQTGLIFNSALDVQLGEIAPLSYSSTEPSWIIECNEVDTGSYLIYVEYSGENLSENSLNDKTIQVIVRSAPPIIISKQPEGVVDENSVELQITTDEYAHCRFSQTDMSYDSMPNDLIGEEQIHTYDLNLADGDYQYYARCVDQYDNKMQNSDTIEFTVDTIGPVLTIYSPNGMINTGDVLINLSTNEDATCKFDLSNKNYNDMSNTLIGSFLQHRAQIALNEGEHVLYIKCKDSAGNIGENIAVVDISLPPTASIEIEKDDERINQGIFQVMLTTSERVSSTPRLYYKFDNTNIRKEITLEGSGTSWEGYMILTDRSNELIGSFDFSATDIEGNVGTEITSGKLFIVDTLAPEIPRGVRAERLSSGIVLLKWNYDGEEASNFNIYRSTEKYVNYADFLTSTTGRSYLDNLNRSVKEYFYKVSAIDVAGNEGELSDEVNVTINGSKSISVELSNGSKRDIYISESSLEKVESTLKDVGKLQLDIEFVLSDLNNKDSVEKDSLIKLGVIWIIQDNIRKIDLLESELTNMKYSHLSDAEIDSRISRIINDIKDIESETPIDIDIIESSEIMQAVELKNIDYVVDILPLSKYDESQKQDYIDSNYQLSKDVVIKRDVRIVEIRFFDGNKEQKTIIIESYDKNTLTDTTDLIVLEYIPKKIESVASNIKFMDSEHIIILEDPLIRFSELDLESGVWYIINQEIKIDDAREIITSVVLNYNDFLEYEKETSNRGSIITGFAIANAEQYGFTATEIIMLFIGLIVMSSLLIYYNVSVRSVFKKRVVDENKWRYEHDQVNEEIDFLNKMNKEDTSSKEIDLILNKEDKKEDISKKQNSSDDAQKLKISDKPIEAGPAEKETTEIISLDKFNKLIDQIEDTLKENNVRKANEVYKQLMKLYSQLQKSEKAIVYKNCIELRNKIIAIKMFQDA